MSTMTTLAVIGLGLAAASIVIKHSETLNAAADRGEETVNRGKDAVKRTLSKVRVPGRKYRERRPEGDRVEGIITRVRNEISRRWYSRREPYPGWSWFKANNKLAVN